MCCGSSGCDSYTWDGVNVSCFHTTTTRESVSRELDFLLDAIKYRHPIHIPTHMYTGCGAPFRTRPPQAHPSCAAPPPPPHPTPSRRLRPRVVATRPFSAARGRICVWAAGSQRTRRSAVRASAVGGCTSPASTRASFTRARCDASAALAVAPHLLPPASCLCCSLARALRMYLDMFMHMCSSRGPWLLSLLLPCPRVLLCAGTWGTA